MLPEERQKLAYDLEQDGKIWPEIAEKLGGVTITRAKELARIYERRKGMLDQAENEVVYRSREYRCFYDV